MTPSCRQAPLQGVAAQSVVKKFAAASLMRSANGSQRSSRSSSSISSKSNINIPPSIRLRATFVVNVPAPALSAPAFPFLPAPAFAIPALTSTKELLKLFMQIYMDTVKNQAETPVQAPALPVSVEPKKQPLKARFPKLYFGKSHLDCYRFCQ